MANTQGARVLSSRHFGYGRLAMRLLSGWLVVALCLTFGCYQLRKPALHLSDIVRKRVHPIYRVGHLGTGSNLLDRAERSSPEAA